MRVAIMQPYFVPYLGYFRLFTTTDVFVVLDSVQFPSEGYVHRNRLPDRLDRPQWLKMPITKTPLHTQIRELAFRPDAAQQLHEQFSRFPSLDAPREHGAGLMAEMSDFSGHPTEYLMRTMQFVCEALDGPWNVVRSSEMALREDLRGQDRVIDIVRQLGGDTYVNSPGGRVLYDPGAFERAGIALRFLCEYDGSSWSVLKRFAEEDVGVLRDELTLSSRVVE